LTDIHPSAVIYPNVTIGTGVTVFPGAVIGRPPLSSGATRRQARSADLLPVRIGNGCVIGANAVIYHNVTIGQDSMICDMAGVREGVTVGDLCVIAMGVTVNYDTVIGNRVKVMDNTHLTGNMTIEDDVFVAMLVTSANDNQMDRKERDVASMGGPVIRSYATIGQGACLLPGVEVGENAIVGSNSVVTRDVPPRTLVMGSPARPVRELRDDELKGV
jgi:acetyltransferase-like isoleucine patch superfamily enzyme